MDGLNLKIGSKRYSHVDKISLLLTKENEKYEFNNFK